ncbi:UpxY family transcription antiterminator [Hymenobacter volaticus]|uniref:UpxY family transcription antiterminator n=1 Tax=Hymenobacter volaticus TaxID=2932254 RepID=A0ABY4G1S9_9BACT|nr:UpxY family transcription antiterminator [Hymenobacter volaticus]UOQ64829.1 UpxY family transcription antiterminator [Hymenobacter volaticus]
METIFKKKDLSITSKKWYVIVSRKLHYKKAASALEKLGLSFYLPLQRQLHYWSDRNKWVEVPIFNPYIFLFSDELERKNIFNSYNSFHFLSHNGKLVTVKEEEVEKVKLICKYSANIKVEQAPIRKGDLVEIIGGPLSGMNGYTFQENGKHRFLVQIFSLGQFASVDIDTNWLKVC